MGYELLNVLAFTLFGIAFVVATVSVLSRLLRPRVEDPSEPAKEETYECGEPTIGSSWVRFDIRFYTLALIFLIFDVEVAFLYPWALIFKTLKSGFGVFIFVEVLLFLGILLVGFAYCWRKGDLDWMKLHAAQVARRRARKAAPREPAPRPERAAAAGAVRAAGARDEVAVG